MKNRFILSLLSSAVLLVSCNSGGSSSSSPSPQYLTAGFYTAAISNYSLSGTLPDELTCDSNSFAPSNPVVINAAGIECTGDGQCSPTPINLNNNPCFSNSQSNGGITAVQAYNNCAVSNNVFTTIQTVSFSQNNATLGSCSFTYMLTPNF